jgi:WhiB family redox-sensing transcriptional regulator
MTDTRWQDRAACAAPGTNADAFFASEREPDLVEEARATCNRCPVRAKCLTEAYTEGDEWGIWGGTTNRERRRFLRNAGGQVRRAVVEATGDTYTLLHQLYAEHTRPEGDHVLWTDERHWFNVRGKPYTVHQLAWLALHRQPSLGRVQRGCEVIGCVAVGCLVDMGQRRVGLRRAS